jgi:hypothetical protein
MGRARQLQLHSSSSSWQLARYPPGDLGGRRRRRTRVADLRGSFGSVAAACSASAPGKCASSLVNVRDCFLWCKSIFRALKLHITNPPDRRPEPDQADRAGAEPAWITLQTATRWHRFLTRIYSRRWMREVSSRRTIVKSTRQQLNRCLSWFRSVRADTGRRRLPNKPAGRA